LQGKAGGFVPGGASLHNCMTPHGVDTATYEVFPGFNFYFLNLFIYFLVFSSGTKSILRGKSVSKEVQHTVPSGQYFGTAVTCWGH
jgi:hypothetical protein